MTNRTIIDLLAKYASENQADWDQQLPPVLRAGVYASTGVSPFSLLYGRQAKLPFDLEAPSHSAPDTGMTPSRTEFGRELQKRLKAFRFRQPDTQRITTKI